MAKFIVLIIIVFCVSLFLAGILVWLVEERGGYDPFSKVCDNCVFKGEPSKCRHWLCKDYHK